MDRVLIATATEKSGDSLRKYITACEAADSCTIALSGADARRRLIESEYDLIVVNAPLPDEFGAELSEIAAVETGAGVLLLAREDMADSVAERVEPQGVFVLSKPLNRTLFFQALRLLTASQQRVLRLRNENRRLQRKIDDLRLIDRCKCILIECCSMTEPEAHSYIEKYAMDQRVSKREAAEQLMQFYEE